MGIGEQAAALMERKVWFGKYLWVQKWSKIQKGLRISPVSSKVVCT